MNLPEISENLIEQLNHGNTKAFDKIYHTYYLYLCAIAVYYVHDKRVAGEIVNDDGIHFAMLQCLQRIIGRKNMIFEKSPDFFHLFRHLFFVEVGRTQITNTCVLNSTPQVRKSRVSDMVAILPKSDKDIIHNLPCHPLVMHIAVYRLVFVENTDGIVGLRNDCRAPVYLIGILFF